MTTHPEHNWVQALPHVQAAKNRCYHRGIKRLPFEALFGRRMAMGNKDGKNPSREERGLAPGDELDILFPALG